MPRFVHLRKPEISGYVNEVKKNKDNKKSMTFFKKQLQFTNTLTDSGKKREKLQRRAHFFQYNTVF